MPSIDNMISDVELRLSHAKPSDDFAIPREQIRFWLDTASASLMSEWIKKRNGGIVLLHETHRYSIMKLDELLTKLEQEGYQFSSILDKEFSTSLK